MKFAVAVLLAGATAWEMPKWHHKKGEKGFIGKEFDKVKGFFHHDKKGRHHGDKKERHHGGRKHHGKSVANHPYGPPPPPRHAHCSIMAEFQHPCDDLWTAMDKELHGMHKGGDHPDPAGGDYMVVKEVKDKALLANRTESFKQGETFVWDIAFEMMPRPSRENHTQMNCEMHGMSRIRNDTRGHDKNSDFCNLFNVMHTSGLNFTEIHAPDCKEMPPRNETQKWCSYVLNEPQQSVYLGLAMGPTDVANFVAGIIDGLIGKNDLPEIQQCLKDSGDLTQDIEDAVTDFEKGDVPDIIKGVELIGKIIQELPQDLQDCGSIQDDLNRIETWAQIFEHPEQLLSTLVSNAIKNHEQVIDDAQKIVQDFNDQKYEQAGEDVGDILVELIGPVPSNSTVFLY